MLPAIAMTFVTSAPLQSLIGCFELYFLDLVLSSKIS